MRWPTSGRGEKGVSEMDENPVPGYADFNWQSGFGAFSVSESTT